MSTDTTAQIARVRAKAKAETIEEMVPVFERYIEGLGGAEDGINFTVRVKFPDNEIEYHYAFVYGGKRWYRTYSTTAMTTEQLVDELVRMYVEAEEMDW